LTARPVLSAAVVLAIAPALRPTARLARCCRSGISGVAAASRLRAGRARPTAAAALTAIRAIRPIRPVALRPAAAAMRAAADRLPAGDG
jgi:hypothetical protein